MLPELEGYDWEQMFGAAGAPATDADQTIYNPGVPFLAVPPTHPDKDKPQPAFTREDVIRVIHQWTSDDDGWSGVAVVELRDGRFAALSGGCDYTGWD